MRDQIITGVICLVVGLAIGFWGANALNKGSLYHGADASSFPPGFNGAGMGQINPSTMQPDIQQILDAAQNDPNSFVAQMKAGDLYAQIGKFDEAISYYQKGVTLKEDDHQANLVLANALFDAGRFEESGERYQRALSLKPDDNNARTDLAATFVERKQPDLDRAIAELKTVLEKDPAHEASLYYLGIAHHRAARAEEAQVALSQLEQANPSSPLVGRLRQHLENSPSTQ
jgi:tetratricopeptide (TPR) repeat protein